ncbi:MAG: ABC transporter [Bacteroidetes bacterium QS_9_68_14]|nr:MAG: ABC transporter [Bacteroidetes bacterium QS_9_68_14]
MANLFVEHVTKRYGGTTAVDDVSFTARPGRILGLLGPNGAGKTSTIRMIAHILAPDEGRVLYDGEPVGPESQQRMGYLPEERGLYKKLKVGEQLRYLAELKGVARATANEKIARWLRRFEAEEWTDKTTEELSKGMQQKVQFIATLLHEPSLYIFDEPFSGLDPLNAQLLREIILELREAGATILFASHRMEQVEQLCDDLCLMSGGRIVLEGPVQEVKSRFGRDTVVLEFAGSGAFLDRLESEGHVSIHNRSTRRAEMRLHEGTPARRVLEEAMQHTDEIFRFEQVAPPLNEIFIDVVGDGQGADVARCSSQQREPVLPDTVGAAD